MPESITAERPAPSQRRQLGMDEASIAFLGRALQSVPMPEESLTQTPARDISAAAMALVERLRRLNMDALFRKQGFLSQLTGADIEAKLRFELDVRHITASINDLQTMGQRASQLRAALCDSRTRIENGQYRLERIIDAAQRVLNETPDADPFLRTRFERRLDNLVTLHASNAVTSRQIDLAERNMAVMIDRVQDVIKIVVPLWQRDALAVAQSVKPVTKGSQLATAFLSTHDQLLQKLLPDTA